MSTSQQLTPIGQICQALDQMEGSFVQTLQGTGINPQRFLITAKTAIQTHQQKDKLEKADRGSLYLAIKKAASDGLMPDGREAALVIYNTKVGEKWVATVQYQPMVQGLVKLARNSGEIESIGAYVVYSADKFSYRAGVDKIPQHDAAWFGVRGEPIGVWAFVKLKSGEYLDPVMLTKERLDRIAMRSKQAQNYDIKEGKDWEEFWKKAAIRNILKYAPRSTHLEQAMTEIDKEFDFTSEDVHLNTGAPALPAAQAAVDDAAPKTETRAAKAVKEKAAKEPETIDASATNVTEGEEVPV